MLTDQYVVTVIIIARMAMYIQSDRKFSKGSIFVNRAIFKIFPIQLSWMHVLCACTNSDNVILGIGGIQINFLDYC